MFVSPININQVEKTITNLENYATNGLRTLVLAKRIIDSKDFANWEQQYLEATTALTARLEKMMEKPEEIEKNFILVGATAIEDRLQDDVSGTISIFKEANIKIWVLTGDKIETAINIGYSCKLLNDGMIKILIDGKDEKSIREAIDQGINTVELFSFFKIISFI